VIWASDPWASDPYQFSVTVIRTIALILTLAYLKPNCICVDPDHDSKAATSTSVFQHEHSRYDRYGEVVQSQTDDIHMKMYFIKSNAVAERVNS